MANREFVESTPLHTGHVARFPCLISGYGEGGRELFEQAISVCGKQRRQVGENQEPVLFASRDRVGCVGGRCDRMMTPDDLNLVQNLSTGASVL